MASSCYSKTTHEIDVTVVPLFIKEECNNREESRYIWAYRVQIKNNRSIPVQLKSRWWRIVDNTGCIKEIAGEGVVGEQPWVAPGETYEYASGASLTTPSGIVLGSYHMETTEGSEFDIDVPAFSLDSPYQEVLLH